MNRCLAITSVGALLLLLAPLRAQRSGRGVEERFRVRVIDASGDVVAGMPVALADDDVRHGRPAAFPLGVTGADGLLDCANPLRFPGLGPRLGFPVRDPVVSWVPDEHGVVVVKSVPHGALRLWLEPDSDVVEATIRCLPRGKLFAGQVRADRSVEFSHIGLGLELEIVLTPVGDDQSPRRLRMSGPTRPHEMLVEELEELGSLHRRRVRARVVGQSSLPLLHTAMMLRCPDPRRAGRDVARVVRTDGEGRIELDLPCSRAGEDAVVAQLSLLEPRVHGGAVEVRFPSAGGGPQELGTLRLQDEELVLGGCVVGPDGAPLAGLTLRTASSLRWLGAVPSGYDNRWRRVAPTAADGRFELYGEHEPQADTVWMKSAADAWLLESRGVPVGTDDVRLRAIPAASVRVAGAFSTHGFRGLVRLVAEGSGRTFPLSDAADGFSWRWAKVPAQRYRIECVQRFGGTLFQSDAFDLRQGVDLALPPLSAAALGRVLSLSFVDQDGAVVRGGNLQVDWNGGTHWVDLGRECGEDGVWRCWIGDAGLPAMKFRHAHYRAEPIAAGAASRRLTLRPRPEVLVRIAGAEGLGGRILFRVGRAFDDERDPVGLWGHGRSSAGWVTEFVRDGRARLFMPASGPSQIAVTTLGDVSERILLDVLVPESGVVEVEHRVDAAVVEGLRRPPARKD